MPLRYLTSSIAAAAITFGVFFLMQELISGDGGSLQDEPSTKLIDFVRLKRESELELKKRKLPEKQKPPEAPPPPKMDLSRSLEPGANVEAIMPVFSPDLDLGGGPYLGEAPSDSDAIPLVRVNPLYPITAAERGIEGWVSVEFSISETGAVKDAKIVDSNPGSIFNRAALRAISKWKYKPKIVDGVPVERHGIKVKLTFELDD